MSQRSAGLGLAVLVVLMALVIPVFATPRLVSQVNLAKDKTLRMVIREPTSMDPNLAGDHSIWYVAQIFEGLYKVLDDGTIRWLGAKSMEISKDGLTWTFRLNPAARWSDGRPVTASDYEWSWKRPIDPKLASDVASFYVAIKGADDYISGKLKDPIQIGIKALDTYTLQVTMPHPAPHLKPAAAATYLYPVPRQAGEKYGDKWTEAGNIVSDRVFTLPSWKHDQEMVLVRNESYWGKKPTLPRGIFRIVPAGGQCGT